jgi:CTP:molybdopterin cytidylyltransferase MocA
MKVERRKIRRALGSAAESALLEMDARRSRSSRRAWAASRLPGKVLADVNNRPLLWYVVRRTQLAKLVDQVVVAIPDTAEDLAIAKQCARGTCPASSGLSTTCSRAT